MRRNQQTNKQRSAECVGLELRLDGLDSAVARLHLISSLIQLLMQSQILAWFSNSLFWSHFLFSKSPKYLECVVLLKWSFVCDASFLLLVSFDSNVPNARSRHFYRNASLLLLLLLVLFSLLLYCPGVDFIVLFSSLLRCSLYKSIQTFHIPNSTAWQKSK